MAEPAKKRGLSVRSVIFVALFVVLFVAAVFVFYFVNLICVLGGCGPAQSAPLRFGWFYRFVVELSHENEPLDIEVIVACGSRTRHIMGEGRSAQAIRAPYIYGVRTKGGQGVLVQSPDICDRDVSKNPVPADFLPVVLWAPDANNLEFLIAYLHERAYEQPVSKLKFHRASVTEASEADHKAWREMKWKDNIVPIGDRDADHLGISFFRGEGFFPPGDPRNHMLLRMTCYSFIRVPMPGALREQVRARWPSDRPRFWLLDSSTVYDIMNKHRDEIASEARRRGLWTTEHPDALASFYIGYGVKRPSGIGHIDYVPARPSGEAPRIPYRVETGYPWANDRLFSQPTIDIHADTQGGADQGFGYCYRDVYARYLREGNGNLRPHDQRFFIDGELIGTAPNLRQTAPGAAIVERDEYLWHRQNFPLTYEFAVMQ